MQAAVVNTVILHVDKVSFDEDAAGVLIIPTCHAINQ